MRIKYTYYGFLNTRLNKHFQWYLEIHDSLIISIEKVCQVVGFHEILLRLSFENIYVLLPYNYSFLPVEGLWRVRFLVCFLKFSKLNLYNDNKYTEHYVFSIIYKPSIKKQWLKKIDKEMFVRNLKEDNNTLGLDKNIF